MARDGMDDNQNINNIPKKRKYESVNGSKEKNRKKKKESFANRKC